MFVNYGCGLTTPLMWENFDNSPSLRLRRLPWVGRLLIHKPNWPVQARVGDIVSGLPIPDCSCDAIYCSHVLEHLSLVDFRLALRNTYRYLKPGGVFRLVVPDLAAAINQYNASDSADAASTFLSSGTMLGTIQRPRGLMGIIRHIFGNSRHLWMWDYPGLAKELGDAGFVKVRRAQIGDSAIAAFGEVEDPDRWDPSCCVGVEATR
jgi:SAM-dependent methyltransferase